MPFPVACGCGQKFMAQDHLSGKEVPCPACGNPLLIQPPEATPAPAQRVPAKPAAPKPAPAFKGAPPAAAPASNVQIPVRCVCGRAYKAPGAMRGKSLQCPACGQDVPIPLNPPPAAPALPAPVALDLMTDPFGAAPLGADPLGADLFGSPLAGGPLGTPMGMPMAGAPLGAPMQAAQPMNPYGMPQSADDGGGNTKLLIFLGGGVAVVLVGLLVGIFFIKRNNRPVASAPATTPASTPTTTPASTPTPATTPPAGAGANPMGPMGGTGPMGAAADPMGGMGPMGGMNPMGDMGMGPMGGVAAGPAGVNPMGPMGTAADPASNGGIVGTAPTTAAGPGAGGVGGGMGPMGATGPMGADPTGAATGPMGAAAGPMGVGNPMGPMGPMGVGTPGVAAPGVGTPGVGGPMGPMGPPGRGGPGRPGVGATSSTGPGATRPGRSGNGEAIEVDDAAALAAARPGGKALGLGLVQWHSKGKQIGVRKVGEGDNLQGHYSWMHSILPFIGHQDIYDKFDLNKKWSDKSQLQNCARPIPEFLNPADDRLRWKGYPFENFALTHFVGMSGLEDARNVVAAKLPRTDPRAGIFGYDAVATPAEITDGTSNTIMALGSGEITSPWIMGGGATIRGAREPYFDKITGFGSKGTSGVIVVMADGSVRTISSSVSPAVFRALCTIHGNETEKIDLTTVAPLSTEK